MVEPGFECIGSVDDLEEGTLTSVELSTGEQVCVVQLNGEVYAISNECPHAQFPMSDGEMVDDYAIECGMHGAQFDVRDGSVVEPPATEPINCYETRIIEGEVWIRPEVL